MATAARRARKEASSPHLDTHTQRPDPIVRELKLGVQSLALLRAVELASRGVPLGGIVGSSVVYLHEVL